MTGGIILVVLGAKILLAFGNSYIKQDPGSIWTRDLFRICNYQMTVLK